MPDRDRPAVVALAHLAWDGVWQRPQQLLSRLARHYPVLYVNEPWLGPTPDGRPALAPVAAGGGVEAWQPRFPDRPEVLARWRPTYAALVADLLLRRGWLRATRDGLAPARPLVAWLTTPTPWYVLDRLPATAVVYDAMDELAAFKGAAPDLAEREDRLLARADLVFAGGRSLHAARRGRHPRVHLFPSGVDAAHFAPAADPATPPAPELAALPRPVLGYYGVIDERLDLGLVAALAAADPSWSVVLVGPVAKLAPGDLPRAPNLHYLGPRPYAALPRLLRGFDACLMPFALNEATRHISPTKALEYLAAGKPVVSTPVPDVAASWADAVHLAPAAGFAEAVRAALAEPPATRAARAARSAAHVAGGSWERIVGEMRRLIDDALARREGAPPLE